MDLAFAGLARHADLIAAGELSSRALVELFLGRIDRLDPLLNAFRVVLREQALAQADQADARRRAGDRRPLLGVPIAIKDDIHVAGRGHGLRLRRRPAAGARRLRGGAQAAGRGRGDHRQDARAGADGDGVHRVADVRRHPQSLGRASHARAARAAARRPRSPPAWPRPRSAPTERARSAFPRRAAGSSGSSRSAAGSRPLRRSHAAPRDDRVRPDRAHGRGRRAAGRRLKDGGPSFAEAARDVSPGGCGSRSRPACRRSACRPDAEQLGGVHSTAALLRELGHEVVEREFDWDIHARQSRAGALRARGRRHGGRARPPRPALAPRARDGADRHDDARPRGRRRGARRPPPTPSG